MRPDGKTVKIGFLRTNGSGGFNFAIILSGKSRAASFRKLPA
jgi:hypothetical protein